jgi:hypothetical protein
MLDGRALPDGWGADTSAKLTAETARSLAAARYQGEPLLAIARYVSRAAPQPYDVTSSEAAMVTAQGLGLWLVQHAALPGWRASGDAGKREGDAAAFHAHSIGYVPGCSLAFDLEGCADAGAPVVAHATEWALTVRAAGFSPLLYVGYAAGLGPDALGELPFDAFWSDAGPRGVRPQGFVAKQGMGTLIGGVLVDPNRLAADARGVRLVAMVDVDAERNVETGDPAARNEEP